MNRGRKCGGFKFGENRVGFYGVSVLGIREHLRQSRAAELWSSVFLILESHGSMIADLQGIKL